jgi:hypothetical protein
MEAQSLFCRIQEVESTARNNVIQMPPGSSVVTPIHSAGEFARQVPPQFLYVASDKLQSSR